MLEELLEVLVILARPILRIILIVVALHIAIPRGKALKKGTDAHLIDILAIELVGIDVEMMSPSIQILLQLLRNLYHWEFIDLIHLARLLVGPVVERLARAVVHHQIHMDKEIKAHLGM